MDNHNMHEMTDEHIKLLKSYGYWDNIVKNRRKLVKRGWTLLM